jgi:hypothetical protein
MRSNDVARVQHVRKLCREIGELSNGVFQDDDSTSRPSKSQTDMKAARTEGCVWTAEANSTIMRKWMWLFVNGGE